MAFVDTHDTHYVYEGYPRFQSVNLGTGLFSSHEMVGAVRKKAWKEESVIIKQRYKSGKKRGQHWWKVIPIQQTQLTSNYVKSILATSKVQPVSINLSINHYFGMQAASSIREVEKTAVSDEVKKPEVKQNVPQIPALMDLTKSDSSEAIKKVTNVNSVSVDASDERKIIEAIHTAEKFKPSFLKMSDLKWKLMIRTVLRGKNIMLTGPSGEGKTLSVHAVKAALGRPFFYINLGNMQDPQTALIGKTHFVEGEGTKFIESYFVKALKTPNAIILLDEFSRLNDDAENILMSVLDYNQRYLRLTEDEDSETVNVAQGVCFIATANLGNEYTSTKVLDRAMLDRFSRIEIEELDKENRIKLISEIYPNIPKQLVKNIAELANQISIDYHSDSPTVENLISTRMCVETADYINDGFLLSEAVEATVYPFFDKDGGPSSQRAFVMQIVQKFGSETRPSLDGTATETAEDVVDDRPLFGEEDFDILK